MMRATGPEDPIVDLRDSSNPNDAEGGPLTTSSEP